MFNKTSKKRKAGSVGRGGFEITRLKEFTEVLTSATGLGYRAAALIGALATFAYLRIINFFPSGMTPGEVIFFLFIALAFAITYLIMIGYGAFSTLWIVNVLTGLRSLISFNQKSLTAELFRTDDKEGAGWLKLHDRWRLARFRASRAKLDDTHSLPTFMRGWFLGISSFLIFLYLVLTAIERDSVVLTEQLIGVTGAGFVVVVFVSIKSKSNSDEAFRARILGLVLLPALILFFYASPKPLLNIVFDGLGIYVPNAALELPASELDAVQRISEHIGRPFVDCRRPGKEMILIHGVDVLWTGIGDQTVVRFGSPDPKRRKLFSPDPEFRQVQMKFDTKSLRIVKTMPGIDPCFKLYVDGFPESGRQVISDGERKRLLETVKAAARGGELESIVVRTYDDTHANVMVSKHSASKGVPLHVQRITAIVEALTSATSHRSIKINTEISHANETMLKCDDVADSSRCLRSQCAKSASCIELDMKYRREW